MIGQISGKLLKKSPPLIVLDVNGIGYEIFAPIPVFAHLKDIGTPTTLHTHLVIRDDAHVLYGFLSQTDRDLFRRLITVSGIGAKIALAMLSTLSADDVVLAINQEEITSLVAIPGVGRKTAERLVVELRGSFTHWQSSVSPSRTTLISKTDHEAQSALVQLGYREREAARAIASVRKDMQQSETPLTTENLIRQALKRMLQ